MKILGRMLVVLAGGLIALLPPAEAATCKGGKRADSAGRCKATTAKKPSAKAKAKAKAKARTKGKARDKAAATPDKGPLYVFIESGGCRILATETSVRRMQEIAVGGSVTWDGRCAEGLISGTGVLRQEGVFIEGGRSKHFAYYYSGKAKNGVRTGPWTRESLERFDDSARSWTSLARVEFLNGVAKGAPKPIPVRGADQHSKSFTTRVLDPEAKRAQAIAPPVPLVADADALSLRTAAVATLAPAVVPAAPPPSMPAPVAPDSQTQARPQPPASAPAPTPTAVPVAPKATLVAPSPPAPAPVQASPVAPRPAVVPTIDAPPRVTATIPTPSPTVAPAPTSAPLAVIKAPPPAPIPPAPAPPAPPVPPKPAMPATVTTPPAPIPEPAKVAAIKPAPGAVAPAPTPAPTTVLQTPKVTAPPPPAPVVPPVAIQAAPARPAVVALPPPPAAIKLTRALPAAMEKQAFGFGTGCYMDTLDGQLWENAVLKVTDRKSLRIDGWAVDDEERVLAEATYLRLEGTDGRRYHAATTVQERPDVARHFGIPAFVKAGYRAVVSAEGLPPGEYEVTVVMNSKGRNVLCGNGRRLKL